MQTKCFFQMSYSALSASFEYLCYGSTAIIFFYSISAGVDFRRQNLTSILTSNVGTPDNSIFCNIVFGWLYDVHLLLYEM